jgi:hypothetical protein
MSDDMDSVVYAINELQASIERISNRQESFQREMLDLLKQIEASVSSMSMDRSIADNVNTIGSDVSIIADRYRPTDDEYSD